MGADHAGRSSEADHGVAEAYTLAAIHSQLWNHRNQTRKEVQVIPAEAVEAAAKGIFDVRDDPYDLDEWEDLDSTAREPYVCNARAALEAAAPYMLNQGAGDE